MKIHNIQLLGRAAIIFAAMASANVAIAGRQFNCSMSAETTLSHDCRPLTFEKADNTLLDPMQALFTLKADEHQSDPIYAALIDRSFKEMNKHLAVDFEFNDPFNVFLSLGIIVKGETTTEFINAIDLFPAQHAGCNFTREQVGNLQITRSFLVAYLKGNQQKFGVVHLQLTDLEKLHAQRPSQRQASILAVEFYPLIPGKRVSNEILRTHVVKDPSLLCSKIIGLMDAAIIQELREN